MPSSTKAGTKPLRFSPTRFFVTLQEFSAFLYLKAVWGIDGKWGYELATVLRLRIGNRTQFHILL